MFVIEVNTVSNYNQWVLDTGFVSHICTNMQGVINNRRLNKGELNLRVGNGARAVALTIGSYVLSLPSGLRLILEDCFYVLAITKNIVSISSLIIRGFHLTFNNKCCTIMLNDVLYANGTLNNGIYMLDMSGPILPIHENKRQRQDNLKSSYLWHCRLGHISEKRLTKIHRNGNLGSFDYESYVTHVSLVY